MMGGYGPNQGIGQQFGNLGLGNPGFGQGQVGPGNGSLNLAGQQGFGQQLGQAKEIMARRVQDSPVLRQWWNDKTKAGETVAKVMDEVKAFSDYLGDEVVISDMKDYLHLSEVRIK